MAGTFCARHRKLVCCVIWFNVDTLQKYSQTECSIYIGIIYKLLIPVYLYNQRMSIKIYFKTRSASDFRILSKRFFKLLIRSLDSFASIIIHFLYEDSSAILTLLIIHWNVLSVQRRQIGKCSLNQSIILCCKYKRVCH